MLRLKGIIAAPFTPMKEDGSVNYSLIKEQAELFVNDGISGAFVCGTSGEGLLLTTEERKKIAEAWLKASAGRLKVVVHISHHSLVEQAELSKHASANGADAVAIHAPSLFKIANVDDLAEYCKVSASASPKTPFYFYHMPAMNNTALPMIELLKKVSNIPNFAGIKFTYENIMDYSLSLNFEKGRYDVLFGRDEIFLSALAAGAEGAVGSTYNFAAPLYLEIMNAFKSGNMKRAMELQLKATSMIEDLVKLGGLPAIKSAMRVRGIDCGPCRLPLKTVSAKNADEILKLMKNFMQKEGMLNDSKIYSVA